MVIHPNVYKKAQEEIDRVVGPDRLPDIQDRDSLPYLRCIILELYRYELSVQIQRGVPYSRAFTTIRYLSPTPLGKYNGIIPFVHTFI